MPDVAALVAMTDNQANVLIAVATGGPRIAEVNPEYVQRHNDLRQSYADLGLRPPFPRRDVWAWYGSQR